MHTLHVAAYVLHAQDYVFSFRPLVYLFCKQIESVQSVHMLGDAVQVVAMMYHGARLLPSVFSTDNSDGLRRGMLLSMGTQSRRPDVHKDRDAGMDAAVVPLNDYAHMAWKYTQGKLLRPPAPHPPPTSPSLPFPIQPLPPLQLTKHPCAGRVTRTTATSCSTCSSCTSLGRPSRPS